MTERQLEVVYTVYKIVNTFGGKMDTNTALEQAKLAATRGDKSGASAILVDVVTHEPRNEAAWLLLSEMVWRKEHALDCLERVLRLNPNNEQARRKLEELKQGRSSHIQQEANRPERQPVQTSSPTLIHKVIQPQSTLVSPPASVPNQNRVRRTKPFEVRWVVSGVLCLLVCGLLTGGALLFRQNFTFAVPQPRVATVIVPATPNSQVSPSPSSPALVYPTLPPAWTPTAASNKPKPTQTLVVQQPACRITLAVHDEIGLVALALDGYAKDALDGNVYYWYNVCPGAHVMKTYGNEEQTYNFTIPNGYDLWGMKIVKTYDTGISVNNAPYVPPVCYNCP